MTEKIKLSRPIKRGDTEIKEIELRELTVYDLEATGAEDNTVTAQVKRIAKVSGLTEDEVRGLAIKDYMAASKIVNAVFI